MFCIPFTRPILVKTLIGSIWPSIYTMKNVMPASTSMNSADFLCFWLFLIVSVPLLWVPPENFRKPFLATAVISTTCCFALFIWSLARAHGAGPLVKGDESTIVGVTPVKGSALAWAFFYGISSQMGQICAGILNMSEIFPYMVSSRMGANGTFFFFSALCAFTAIFTFIWVPETKAVPIECCEALFSGGMRHRAWRAKKLFPPLGIPPLPEHLAAGQAAYI